jgi:hypothetical protein
MMSYTMSAAWSRSVLSLCCTEHGPYHGAVLSDRITSVSMSRSSQLGRRYTVAVCISAGASVTHERALETCEPSYVPRAAKHFFIPVVHNPLGAGGHVAASKLPSQEGRAWRPPPLRKTEPETLRHMAAPKLTSARRRGPEPRDTWQRQSSPQQGGEMRS